MSSSLSGTARQTVWNSRSVWWRIPRCGDTPPAEITAGRGCRAEKLLKTDQNDQQSSSVQVPIGQLGHSTRKHLVDLDLFNLTSFLSCLFNKKDTILDTSFTCFHFKWKLLRLLRLFDLLAFVFWSLNKKKGNKICKLGRVLFSKHMHLDSFRK